MSLAGLMIHTAKLVTDAGAQSPAGAYNRDFSADGSSFSCNIQPERGPRAFEYMREEFVSIYNIYTVHSQTVAINQRIKVTSPAGVAEEYVVVDYIPSLRLNWPNKIVVGKVRA